jgi:hypothetical protein
MGGRLARLGCVALVIAGVVLGFGAPAHAKS